MSKAGNHFDNVVKAQIEKADCVADMFKILIEEYDLTKPIGRFVRIALIAGLKKAVAIVNPEIKKR